MITACASCRLTEGARPPDWASERDWLRALYDADAYAEGSYYQRHRDAWIQHGDLAELTRMLRHVYLDDG